MRIIRLYTGADGESHFAELELVPAGDIGALSAKVAATGVIFRQTDEDYDFNWQNAPCRQYM